MRAEAVIFDLDGVIADTAALHRRSWEAIATRYGIPFDEQTNDRMRGLTRPQSLQVFLERAPRPFSADEQHAIIELKNQIFLDDVARLRPQDALPGARELIEACRRRGVRLAVASSSRNVTAVLEQLELAAAFEVLVDARAAPRSKPDPQAFSLAAERLGVSPANCIAIEDGQAGVDAARAAGMCVVGVGPSSRLQGVDLLVPDLTHVTVDQLLALPRSGRLDALSIGAFLGALASNSPTPGGGAAAALCGGLAAALGRMVAAYTIGRPKFADVQAEVAALDAELGRAAALLATLMEEDASAYANLGAAMKLDRGDPARAARIQEAALIAGAVPLETLAICARVLRLAERLAATGNPMLRSDAHCAMHFARAAGRAAAENVRVNLPMIEAGQRSLYETQLSQLLSAFEPDPACFAPAPPTVSPPGRR